MIKETIIQQNGQPVKVLEVEYRWYTLKELSSLIYKVDKKTLRRKMKPHEEAIGKRIGYFYDVRQVKRIFQLIPPPYRVLFKNEVYDADSDIK